MKAILTKDLKFYPAMVGEKHHREIIKRVFGIDKTNNPTCPNSEVMPCDIGAIGILIDKTGEIMAGYEESGVNQLYLLIGWNVRRPHKNN